MNKIDQFTDNALKLNGRVIFDNGGGITLQLGGFAHWYQDAGQAATDLYDYLADGTTAGWDGHEDEAADLDPEYEQIRNGGYRMYSLPDILDECQKEDLTGWGNIDDLCLALIELTEEEEQP